MFSTQGATLESVYCIRHLPTWTMSGMFAPTGMLLSVKLPPASVRVLKAGGVYQLAQFPQETPAGSVTAASLGT